MKLPILFFAAGMLWGQTPAPAVKTTSADPVILTAGSTTITKSQFEVLLKNLPESIRRQLGGDGPELRRRFAAQLGEVAVYAEEARKRKLNASAAAKAQLMFQEDSMLAGLLYENTMEKQKPAVEACQAYYKDHQDEFAQLQARQILIRFKGSRVPLREGVPDQTEEEALAAIKVFRERIVKGEEFARVAESVSDDPVSSTKGGDLGTVRRGNLVPTLEDAVFALPVGEISQPVKTQFGWHLLLVTQRGSREFAEVRPEIEKRLQTENAQKALQALKSGVRLVLDESYFGKAESAARTEAGAAKPAGK